jgi:hypothetical protein
MWLFLGLGVALIAIAVSGLRGLVEPQVGVAAVTGFFPCLLLAVFFGLKSRRIAAEEREARSAGSMLVLIAGMLKQQDDATLERIAGTSGPAAEAAALLLENRRQKAGQETQPVDRTPS